MIPRDPRNVVHSGTLRSLIRDSGRTLTARQWWQVGGLALLLVLLWTIGLWRVWPLTIMLAGTIVLLIGAVIALLVERARAARRATELERSLQGHAEDSRFGARSERAGIQRCGRVAEALEARSRTTGTVRPVCAPLVRRHRRSGGGEDECH